jgi:type IV secretory pathway VirB2 component (pilin)
VANVIRYLTRRLLGALLIAGVFALITAAQAYAQGPAAPSADDTLELGTTLLYGGFAIGILVLAGAEILFGFVGWMRSMLG